jgi:hypothetical protein
VSALAEGELRARVLSICVRDERRTFDPSSAVWRQGLVFTCEGDVLRVIDPADRNVFLLAGGGGDPGVAEGPAKRACFRGVSGLVLDDDGLWFCDIGGGAVRRMRFAGDSVSTLVDGLPAPVHLARAETTFYVACRQGELLEIDTTTDERRPLETLDGGPVMGVAIIGRTLYVATASGWIFGVDRTSRRVTQRLEVDGMPSSVVRNGPWLYLGLPGRIEKLRMPDGASERMSGDDAKAAVAQPRALAIVERYNNTLQHFFVDGLYFFGAGNLCWLDRHKKAISIVVQGG